jgi:ElaB/YqjD/DUF883 family membrane-anchored ribosome-binding protein
VSENLHLLESDVEEARAKLAEDLALLRSPQTYRQSGAALKSEAQAVSQRILDDLKARAAANPSAALAIGAGIGWRLFKHPPIATALIGVGLLSLWRTKAMPIADQNYLTTAQRRLGEQVSEAANTVKDYAVDAAVASREKVGAYAQSAVETAEEFAASATERAADTLEGAREAAADVSNRAVTAAQRATAQAITDNGVRDQVLLGVAGAAVVAALGIAYRRRKPDELRAWE